MTTLERLKAKSAYQPEARMPSIKQISQLLTDNGIEHEVSERTNTVERRTPGRRYVNMRREGKTGLRLVVADPWIELDTSDSYYSYNTSVYARKLVDLITSKRETPSK